MIGNPGGFYKANCIDRECIYIVNMFLTLMNIFDRVLDFVLDKENSRQMLQFLFFIDLIVVTLTTMWNPTIQGILAMLGFYLMLLIPVLVLYRQRRKESVASA